MGSATTKAISTQNPSLPSEQVLAQLERILASSGFSRAPRMKRFLRYVVEARLRNNVTPEELKESVIGVTVFDRDADYDPKSDPVVRVEARRLRSKLEEYYAGPGSLDPVQIDIPKGSYVPRWRTQGEAPLVVPAPQGVSKGRWWVPVAILVIAILAGVAGRTVWRKWTAVRHDEAAAANQPIRALAVLPFQNVSGDKSQDYLVSGFTDELTTDLAKLGGVRVISRSSARRYVSGASRLADIARDLKVDAVVEGSIRTAGERIRVTAQLIRTATDSYVWVQTYERDGGDLFALQQEISARIAEEIGTTLTLGPETRNASITPAAYDAYLRGRYFWNRRTLDGLEKSIDYYQRAIGADHDYAKAYSALGDSYVLLSSYGGPPPAESFSRARQAARQALQLDGSLAEAHTVLAAVKVGYDWDWPGATREYETAIRLDPNYPTARHWFSLHLSRIGRHDAAKVEIERALELDPLSLIINTDAAETFYWAREPGEALNRLKRALELDSNFAEAYLVQGKIFEEQRQYGRALQSFEKAEHLFGDLPNVVALKAHALALGGRKAEALSIAAGLEKAAASRYVSGVDLGLIYCAAGDTGQAMSHLNHAFANRGKGMDILGTDPLFDGCRADAGFQQLLRQLNLVQ